MFANFKKAFKRDESNNKNIPKAILDAMSDNLPNGLVYAQIDKEYCKVVPEKGDVTFKFDKLKIKVPKHIKLTTVDELSEFLYRTQQELVTNTDSIIINGEEIEMSEYIQSPYKEIDPDSYKFTITPASFGDPVPLKIEYAEAGIKKEFLIARQPLADMNKSLFKSVNSDVLELKFTIDEEQKNLKFNVNLDIKKAYTVLEVIEAFKVYIAFIDGEIKIDGIRLNSVPNEKEKAAASAALEYWEMVQTVSEKLKVQFKPNEGDDDKNAEWIAKLYRSFVENKSYKQRSGTTTFVTKSKEDLVGNELLLDQGPMALQYALSEEVNVYGANIQLYSAKALLNCKVQSVIPVEDRVEEYEFKVIPATDEGIYKAARHFSTEEDLNETFKDMGEALEELSQAKEL
ncbi:abortive phage resistance protein [Bacillus thuringiensis]|uniref:Abortive phage resistance protein n=1 Tax=Bacillus thuringiensis TaxID=1428 RepID=A0A9X6TWF6_BACTU|nr:abortive infection system toxin AbiGii family protein [Bacillus thuringiensis]EKS8379422.1 abortive phage resistance protein [Bacillus cereus]EKS8384511.1 abortive phage resistance protein [Bacillus cereus]PED11820.1 abortive phage resistance protein [Bacillus thuringiensis]